MTAILWNVLIVDSVNTGQWTIGPLPNTIAFPTRHP
jgi:hypothetical protein